MIILEIAASYIITLLLVDAPTFTTARKWIVSQTPRLEVHGQHLLHCTLCAGFWVSLAVCLYYEDIENFWIVYAFSYFLKTQER